MNNAVTLPARHRASGPARFRTPRPAGTPGSVRRVATGLGLGIAAVTSTAALAVGSAQPAQAYPAEWSASERAQYERDIDARNYEILQVAQSLEGTPYRYGGSSPSSGFDCSGFTSYVYDQVGIGLPRTSGAQADAVTEISQASAKAGDLVFFHDGGGVYHVAIYAGGDKVWHAPNSGGHVEMVDIWDSSITFGRA